MKKPDLEARGSAGGPGWQGLPRATGAEDPQGAAADTSPEPFEYFADPTPEMLAAEAAIGAAYEEGRALYGDEDGDAWVAALENGSHPLYRVKTAA